MNDKLDRALCMALKEAISDERTAPPMYKKLKEELSKAGVLTKAEESRINKIIQDEKDHEKFFTELAEEKGLCLSTIKPGRKLYADLPLSERIKASRALIEKSYQE